MTIASSGPVSFSDLNTEMVRTSTDALSFSDVGCRYLADSATGTVSLSGMLGSSSPGTIDFGQDSNFTSFHNIPDLDIGAASDDRRIILIFFGTQKSTNFTSGWNGTNVQLGSTSFPDITWAWYQGGSGSPDFAAIALHGATVPASEGTTATLTFNTNRDMWCGVAVLAADRTNSTINHDNFVTSSGSASTLSSTIDNQENGINYIFGCRKNTENVTLGGSTKVDQITVNTDYTAFWGIDSRLSATTGRSVDFTGSTNAVSILGGLSATP